MFSPYFPSKTARIKKKNLHAKTHLTPRVLHEGLLTVAMYRMGSGVNRGEKTQRLPIVLARKNKNLTYSGSHVNRKDG